MFYVLRLLTLLILGACASGTFYDSTTARTLGKGETSGTVSAQAFSGAVFQAAHGIAGDVDLGVQFEAGSMFSSSGLFIKYAVLNPRQEGLAVALIGNLGVSGNNSYYSAAGVGISFRSGQFEPALFTKYNYIFNNDDYTFDFQGGPVSFDGKHFGYILFNPGVTYWFTETRALSLNVGIGLQANGTWLDSPAINYGIGFQFGI